MLTRLEDVAQVQNAIGLSQHSLNSNALDKPLESVPRTFEHGEPLRSRKFLKLEPVLTHIPIANTFPKCGSKLDTIDVQELAALKQGQSAFRKHSEHARQNAFEPRRAVEVLAPSPHTGIDSKAGS